MYPHIQYRDGDLEMEQVSLEFLARHYGTPLYVYSESAIRDRWNAFEEGFSGVDHLICFAVKANSNLAVLALLARLGAGFDIVSVGELERVLRAGGDPGKVVFSGVGKGREEIRRALEVGIRCFNIESEPELERVNGVALELGLRAPISLRVNPDVDAGTHPYISTGLRSNKFGIAIEEAERVYRNAATLTGVEVVGVDCHIGSQLTELAPFGDALDRVLALVERLRQVGIVLRHIDIGGGLGIDYRDDDPPTPQQYGESILQRLDRLDLEVVLEPGRAMVGNAGVLLTTVEYLKRGEEKNFCVVDAAMNDLVRPSLYSAWQRIEPLQPRSGNGVEYDVVGPICETGDFLGLTVLS